MPIARTSVQNANALSQDAISQINDLTEKPVIQTVTQSKLPVKTAVIQTVTKTKYGDNLNLRFPEGERDRLKVFCAGQKVSMTQFILFAVDYLQSRVEDGRCRVSKSGVKEIHE